MVTVKPAHGRAASAESEREGGRCCRDERRGGCVCPVSLVRCPLSVVGDGKKKEPLVLFGVIKKTIDIRCVLPMSYGRVVLFRLFARVRRPSTSRAYFPCTPRQLVWECPNYFSAHALPLFKQVMELKDVNAALVGHKNSRQKIQQVRCAAVHCGPRCIFFSLSDRVSHAVTFFTHLSVMAVEA